MSPKSVRLTLIFTLIWTTILSASLIFSKTILDRTQTAYVHDALSADWGALKSYLHIEHGKPTWYFDNDDSDQAAIVARLRAAFLLTDAAGHVLESSPSATWLQARLPVPPPQTPSLTTMKTDAGVPYLVWRGTLRDESGSQQYYGFIAHSIRQPLAMRLLRNGFFLICLALGLSFLLTTLMVRHCTIPFRTA